MVGAGNPPKYEAEADNAPMEHKPFDIYRKVIDKYGEADERKV